MQTGQLRGRLGLGAIADGVLSVRIGWADVCFGIAATAFLGWCVLWQVAAHEAAERRLAALEIGARVPIDLAATETGRPILQLIAHPRPEIAPVLADGAGGAVALVPLFATAIDRTARGVAVLPAERIKTVTYLSVALIEGQAITDAVRRASIAGAMSAAGIDLRDAVMVDVSPGTSEAIDAGKSSGLLLVMAALSGLAGLRLRFAARGADLRT